MNDITFSYDHDETAFVSAEIPVERKTLIRVDLTEKGYLILKRKGDPLFCSGYNDSFEVTVRGDGRIQAYTSVKPTTIQYVNL